MLIFLNINYKLNTISIGIPNIYFHILWNSYQKSQEYQEIPKIIWKGDKEGADALFAMCLPFINIAIIYTKTGKWTNKLFTEIQSSEIPLLSCISLLSF